MSTEASAQPAFVQGEKFMLITFYVDTWGGNISSVSCCGSAADMSFPSVTSGCGEMCVFSVQYERERKWTIKDRLGPRNKGQGVTASF